MNGGDFGALSNCENFTNRTTFINFVKKLLVLYQTALILQL